MKLTRLELFGFKSFPQRTDIRFGEGITGIVGPNGSGKSNIADAVRWVLGEQSAKALRGAKMEDVIFSGTQKRRLMPYCEVSLVFDNADRKLKSPHTEVMVTRRAYRSGEGEYFLNRRACRLKDIVELFHDTGIGREGYAMIGQGHIDVILSGRGEERRAAFEEAAGIAGYRSRKEDAQRKLDRTQEHLLRVSDLLEELSGRLEPLREQSEAAREYLALSARLRHLDANIFLVRHERLDKRIASLQETQKSIAGLIARHEAELKDLQHRREAAQESLSGAEERSQALNAQLQSQEDALRDQAVLAERSAQALQNAKDEAQTNLQEQQATLDALQTLREALQAAQSDREQNHELLKRAEERLIALEARTREAEEELDKSERALESHRSLMLQSANRRADARERHARQQTMLAQAQARLQELSDNEGCLRAELEYAQDEAEAATARLDSARRAVARLYEQLRADEQDLRASRQAADEAQAQLDAARQTYQRDRARLLAMEEMSKSNEGFFQPVKQALAYAQGKPGVHGVVARLITVPRELETAVEMVLGNALQNIVTDTEETAQEMINHLREKHLGRTTFLPISAVRGRTLTTQERQALTLSGCLGLASELVGYADEYKGIVESLLGRTVVARDLGAAIAISRAGRQAFHVVTLQGDVMRAGGAMTGGSIQSRTVSLLGREREMKELAQSLTDQADALAGMNTAWQQKRQTVGAQEEQVTKARAHAQDEEIGIAREEEQEKQATQRLERAAEALSQAQAAGEQLFEMVADLTRDLDQADAASRMIDADKQQLEQTEAQLKHTLAVAREQADNAREALAAQRQSCGQLAHKVDIFSRDSQRVEKELNILEARKAALESKQGALAQRIVLQQVKLDEQMQAHQQQNSALAALRDQARQAEKTRREITALTSQLSGQAERVHRLHSEDSQRLHKGDISLTRLEEEQHSMAQTLWNTYELTYALAQELMTPDKFELPAAEREAMDIRKRIKEMGAINIHALDEYAATLERFEDLSAQRDDANQAREDLLNLIKRLQGQMEKQFVREFALLNEYFAETFKRLFKGGQASLSLADPSQPLECEIHIKAQPPGKKLQLLSLLSGGERTLTAIAILFAMLKLKPAPFCILDEIEAALDDVNIESFAEYLSEYAKSTQFIVITHRKGTMESCDTLYGVTMREKGVSDMISVNLEEYTA